MTPSEKSAARPAAPTGRLQLLPLLDSLRGYDAGTLRRDAVAGLNVALIAVPQGMAYAMIAGLPHEASGILCSAAAAIVGALFSAARFTILGPTNATALMLVSATAATAAAGRVELLPLLVLLSGLLLITAALLGLADLIQYVSRSVIVGYVSGAALLIAAGQLKDALGITAGDKATGFFTMMARVTAALPTADMRAATVAALAVAGYAAVRRWKPKWPAFALVLTGLSVGVALIPGASTGLRFLESFRPGDLIPDWGAFREAKLPSLAGQLLGPAFAVAFLTALENSVMGKALSGRAGDQPKLNQDLFGCGMANLASACAGGMPASGSLTRSSLNFASGARTPMSSLLVGLLCLAAALLLGDATRFMPRAALAALVICATASLINPRHLRICWRATRSDAITLAVTFTATLVLPLHMAIFLGVGTSVALYLRKAARPTLVEYEFNAEGALRERSAGADRQHPRISIVHVEGELFFGAAELFRTQIQRTARDENLRIIILRMKNARHLDATSVVALEDLAKFLHDGGRHLLISGLSREVYRVLRRSGMVEVVGRDNLFMGSSQNPNLSTRNALKRAQVLLGTREADIQIFYNPERPRE